jgi:hypothetical protein
MDDFVSILHTVKRKDRTNQLKVLAALYSLGGLEKPVDSSDVRDLIELHLPKKEVPINIPGKRKDPPATATQADNNADVDSSDEDDSDDLEGISPIAKKWMKRNGLSSNRISQLYSLGVDEIDLVARKVPGTSGRERLRQVMLLQGIASYLNGGVPKIDNQKLKEAATHYDADVGGNFPTYAKEWAAEMAGSRASGDLTLTTRGLTAAKELINQMTAAKLEGG